MVRRNQAWENQGEEDSRPRKARCKGCQAGTSMCVDPSLGGEW